MSRLVLIPVPVTERPPRECLPAATLAQVAAIDLYFAESPKSARAFLKACDPARPIQPIEIHPIAADTPDATLDALLAPVRAGRAAGVLSEAGAPGVADPGGRLVRQAHAAGIRVEPCVGPSAVLLAVMASGLEGQRFAFCGYLPIDAAALRERLRALQAQSARDHASAFFIETPYRNERMVSALLETLAGDTLVSIASDIGGATESIATRTVAEWRRRPPEPGRRPTVYGLYAARPAQRR